MIVLSEVSFIKRTPSFFFPLPGQTMFIGSYTQANGKEGRVAQGIKRARKGHSGGDYSWGWERVPVD